MLHESDAIIVRIALSALMRRASNIRDRENEERFTIRRDTASGGIFIIRNRQWTVHIRTDDEPTVTWHS